MKRKQEPLEPVQVMTEAMLCQGPLPSVQPLCMELVWDRWLEPGKDWRRGRLPSVWALEHVNSVYWVEPWVSGRVGGLACLAVPGLDPASGCCARARSLPGHLEWDALDRPVPSVCGGPAGLADLGGRLEVPASVATHSLGG